MRPENELMKAPWKPKVVEFQQQALGLDGMHIHLCPYKDRDHGLNL